MPARQRVLHVSEETRQQLASLVSDTARTVAQIADATGLSPTAIRSGLASLPRTHQLREGRTVFYYQLPAEVKVAATGSRTAKKASAAKKSPAKKSPAKAPAKRAAPAKKTAPRAAKAASGKPAASPSAAKKAAKQAPAKAAAKRPAGSKSSTLKTPVPAKKAAKKRAR